MFLMGNYDPRDSRPLLEAAIYFYYNSIYTVKRFDSYTTVSDVSFRKVFGGINLKWFLERTLRREMEY